MQYQFSSFLNYKEIQIFALSQLCDVLNKAGIEVETYFFQNKTFYLDLKIPANRLDLKIYSYFLEEVNFNLSILRNQKWIQIKKNYLKILKKQINVKRFPKKLEIKGKETKIIQKIKWIKKLKKKQEKDNISLQDIYGLSCNHKYYLSYNQNNNLTLYNFLRFYGNKKIPFLLKKSKKKIVNHKILIFNKASLLKILGKENSDSSLLTDLGIDIFQESENQIEFLIPLHRKDLNREIDLVEEYCKNLKYENFKLNYPTFNPSQLNQAKEKIDLIKNFLILSNYTELITNSLTFNTNNKKNNISLLNPLNKDLESLTQSLNFNHLEIFKKLKDRNKKEIKFFEIARLFKIRKSLVEENDFLQCSKLAFFPKKEFLYQWIKTKEDFDRFFEYFNSKDIKVFVQKEYLKENAILYKINNKVIARLFFTQNDIKLEKAYFFIFQLNLNLFLSFLTYPKTTNLKTISKYPEVEKDLSFKSNKQVNLYQLQSEILNNFKNIRKVDFFDIYIDKGINKFGVRLTFQSLEQTLTHLQIEKEVKNIVNKLKNNYNLALID